MTREQIKKEYKGKLAAGKLEAYLDEVFGLADHLKAHVEKCDGKDLLTIWTFNPEALRAADNTNAVTWVPERHTYDLIDVCFSNKEHTKFGVMLCDTDNSVGAAQFELGYCATSWSCTHIECMCPPVLHNAFSNYKYLGLVVYVAGGDPMCRSHKAFLHTASALQAAINVVKHHRAELQRNFDNTLAAIKCNESILDYFRERLSQEQASNSVSRDIEITELNNKLHSAPVKADGTHRQTQKGGKKNDKERTR